jgi:ribonucleoside-diphosphate reductase alpha chain
LDSINATATSIVRYASRKAGLGVNMGRIRGIDQPIRGGDAKHTGMIPFFKYMNGALKSCAQGGVRGASATIYFQWWHKEVESLIVLKNNRGTDETRVRTLDYGVQLNGLFYRRYLKGLDVTLFSPEQVPDLYEAFFADQDKFEELYTAYEKNPLIYKKKISSKDLMATIIQERKSTGRIYIQNVDNVNNQGPFKPDLAPIRQSNLCVSGLTKLDVLIDGRSARIFMKDLPS